MTEETNNIIEEVAKNKVIEKMIKDMKINEYADDLAQDIYLILLEYDQDKIKEVYEKKQFNFFLSRIIANQVFSKTSKFHYSYRKWDEFKRELKYNDARGDGED